MIPKSLLSSNKLLFLKELYLEKRLSCIALSDKQIFFFQF